MRPTISLADLHALPLPGMDAPDKLAFSRDGAWLAFLHAGDGTMSRSLWGVEVASGERHLLAGREGGVREEAAVGRAEQLRRERSRERGLGITEFHWANAATSPVLCAPVTDGAITWRPSGPTAPLTLDGATDPRLAPAGDAIAWVAGGDLWAASLSADGSLGATRRLTDDAAPGITNGLAEYVAAEELDRHRGFWWSASGEAIAYAHVDERGIPPFHIQHLAGELPELEEHRYPFAGGPNARVSLRVTGLDGAQVEVDLGAAEDDYLARVVAEPGGTWLVAVLPRRQTSLRWLRVDATGGARELWNERSDPWINLDNDTRVLEDGRILRTTEASGFRHLELRAADGTPERTLTSGEWMVTSVAGVTERDGAAADVLFHGTRHGVLERHLYAVPLEAPEPVSNPRRLTQEAGWHEATVAADGAWADRWSSLAAAPRVVLHAGPEPRVLHDAPRVEGVHPPDLLEVTAADGTTRLHAALYRPRLRDDNQPPPVVLWVYGGPHSQKVANQWELSVMPWRRLMTHLGVAVLVVDNRGTAHRGLRFEAALDRALGEVEVADQLAAIDELAAHGLVDASRIALTGGSYGGYMTIRSMLRHPDRFATGVAWAPVVDWEGYDTAYTERYLGRPQENPDGYASSSLRPDAARLAGALLVQHGLIDENVHFHHTARLLDAFTRAGVTCDLQLFPGERHGGRDSVALAARDRRAITHLADGLRVALPEDWESGV
ncbi:MAG: DPP IV N-terminal domain-containing protein [Chloroflexota bacterium]